MKDELPFVDWIKCEHPAGHNSDGKCPDCGDYDPLFDLSRPATTEEETSNGH